MTLPADRDTLKTFSRVHGVQTSKQKASIMKDGGTRWNEEIGPESNHHDFALSNPGRQASSHHLDQAYTPDMEMIV
ncbi:hypothetical protein N7462_005229 [Penicillium macrosclerotiorum]|uniref:uncharacterized protein n=1 Tax=Penicillium macrosclerotiorum TaxID=303699 RepID=UPI002547DE79|nr:uncharacterized protein N7462_005229 [Penicillium macrosclerotiorum]KAJ5690837.1 hypothetical protein N7462_005229 [Penicillium macrosclerotiorum]